MKRELVKGMILQESGEDYFLVLSDKGKSQAVQEVIVGDTVYFCPMLGSIKKKDYPSLQVGELTDKYMIEKIEKQLL